MRVKSALGLVSVVAAFGLVTPSAAEAGWCRRAGFCGPQPVRHYIYYPQYRNTYYMANFAPQPYPSVYIPRGYWPRYERPYYVYGRRAWTPRRESYYVVPEPMPVPVERGCCRGRYLK